MSAERRKRLRGVRDPTLVTALLATFTLALGLRFWNLPAELPFHHDMREMVAYGAAVEMVAEATLDPGFRGWPSGLAYLELAPVALLHHVGDRPVARPAGLERSPSMVPEEQTIYLMAGRLLVALLGALAAAVVALGARRFSEGLGVPLLAGLTAAVLPAHLDASQRLWPEAPATLGVALALWGALTVARRGASPRRLLWTGAAIGLAAGFKFAAVLVGLALVVAVALDGERGWGRRLGGIALAALGAAVVLVILSPWVVLAPGETAATLAGSAPAGGLARAFGGLASPTLIGPAVLGLSVVALATVAVPRLREPQGRAAWVVAAPTLAWLLVLAWRGPTATPYVAALAAPALALLVGVTAAVAVRSVRRPVWTTIVLALLGLGLVPTALSAGVLAWSKGLPRTEIQAHDWFVERVPPDGRVARDWAGPHLDPDGFEIVTVPTVAHRGWESLLSGAVDYVVVTSATFRAAERGEADVARFLERLFADRPTAAFCPEPGRVTGPELWVFARSDRARRTTPGLETRGLCRFDRPWLR